MSIVEYLQGYMKYQGGATEHVPKHATFSTFKGQLLTQHFIKLEPNIASD